MRGQQESSIIENPAAEATTGEAIYHIVVFLKLKPQLTLQLMGGYVYLLASLDNVFVYTGVTSNLISRINQHKGKLDPVSYSAQHNCVKLVYYHWYATIEEAITAEKKIKGSNRKKKEIFVELINPEWKDLFPDFKAGIVIKFPVIHKFK